MLIIRTMIIMTIISVAVVGKQVFPVITNTTAVLAKGTVGILPCQYERDISSVLWHKGESLSNSKQIVSLNINRDGNPSRSWFQYTQHDFNITDEFSLVIKNVKVVDEGRYYCDVVDSANENSYTNYTDVSVIAYASRPVIEQCDKVNQLGLSSAPVDCKYDVSTYTTKLNLTCRLRGFKPNVSLLWSGSGKRLEPLHSTQTIMADGTFEKLITLKIDPTKKGSKNISCIAMGKAVNGTVSASIWISNPVNTDTEGVSKKLISIVIFAVIICIVVFVIAYMRWRQMKIERGGKSIAPIYSLVPFFGQNYKRNEFIKNAKKAQQRQKYSDVARNMQAVINMGGQLLSSDERNLLKDAYYYLVNEQRTLVMNFGYESEDTFSSPLRQRRREGKRVQAEENLHSICTEVVELLDKYLIVPLSKKKSKEDIEGHISYLVMKGDFLRYMIICTSQVVLTDLIPKVRITYADAMELSKKKLGPAHPTRLKVSVKLSVFYYEILHQREKACQVTKEAIEKAKEEFETLDRDMRAQSAEYMVTLHSNLQGWTH